MRAASHSLSLWWVESAMQIAAVSESSSRVVIPLRKRRTTSAVIAGLSIAASSGPYSGLLRRSSFRSVIMSNRTATFAPWRSTT